MTSMLQLFDRSSPRPRSAAASQPASVVFDIKQDDSSFIFEAKVPGLNKEDIKVALLPAAFRIYVWHQMHVHKLCSAV